MPDLDSILATQYGPLGTVRIKPRVQLSMAPTNQPRKPASALCFLSCMCLVGGGESTHTLLGGATDTEYQQSTRTPSSSFCHLKLKRTNSRGWLPQWTPKNPTPCLTVGMHPATHKPGGPSACSYLVQKLQFLPTVHELIGVDKAPCHRSGIQDQVLGHSYQHIPVIPSVGEPAYSHTMQRDTEVRVRAQPEHALIPDPKVPKQS